jgi:hypothetical protein
VTQQIASLLRVVAVHRGRVAQRPGVGQLEFAAADAPGHKLASLVDHEVPALIVLEQLVERGPALRGAGALLLRVERPQQVALADRPAGTGREYEWSSVPATRRCSSSINAAQRGRGRVALLSSVFRGTRLPPRST